MAATASAPSLPLAASYLIQQDWSRYTADQHAVWAELVGRRMPQLEEHACQEYLDGFHNIGLRQDVIPDLAKVNTLLAPRTGWNATAVSGYLPGVNPRFASSQRSRRRAARRPLPPASLDHRRRTNRVDRIFSLSSIGFWKWRLGSVKRLLPGPQPIEMSCRGHSPPLSQTGQSSGWLTSRNSTTAL